MFLIETALTFVALAVLGLSGLSILSALQGDRPFSILMAPICGILVLPPATTLFYSTGKLTLSQSAVLAIAATISVSLFMIPRIRTTWQTFLTALGTALIVCAVSALISTATNIEFGTSGILFIDGTDHANYASVADWILSHDALQMPQASATSPYESWPDVGLRLDPRLSSYVTLALVSLLRGSSGLFAYDPACSIVLATAIIGVTGVFARTRLTLFLLIIALFFSVWFEYGRSGFFGKLNAYPSVLFIIGILVTQKEWDAKVMSALGVIVVGAATMHPTYSAVLFFVTIGAIFVGTRFLIDTNRNVQLGENIFGFALCAMVALASSGMFGRIFPMPIGQSFDMPWGAILPRLFEIQNPTLDYIPLAPIWLKKGTFIAINLQIILTAFAIFRRDPKAVALIGGPPLVASIFLISNQNWIAYQMAGCIVPFALCAMADWVEEAQTKTYTPVKALALMLCLGFVSIRIPRAFMPIDRYILHPPKENQFKASDITALVDAIGGHSVSVDIRADRPALVLLEEFGRRSMDVQWSANSWNFIVGYRQWPRPVYANSPTFWLGLAQANSPEGSIILERNQYRLVQLK